MTATIVLRRVGSLRTMVEYKDRLAAAMADSKVTVHQLADELGITYNGVKKALRGGDKGDSEMGAWNNSKAARFMRVDPDWLATGDGAMHSERVWPFGDQITPQQFATLDDKDIQPAIDVLLGALRRKGSTDNGSNGKPDEHAA